MSWYRERGAHQPSRPQSRETGSMVWHIEAFCEAQRVRGFSESTIRSRLGFLGRFGQWCEQRGVYAVTEVTRPMLERYQRWLFQYRQNNGKPLSVAAQYHHLVSVRLFFKWLTRNNHVLHNPASELELPKLAKHLPRTVLTVKEAETVLIQPDVKTPLGVRDRTIMEVLYSTGIRRMELAQLGLYDLDRERGTVLIRLGKGKRDRVVPIGERALMWVDKYLLDVRPRYVVEPDHGVMFISHAGEPLTTNQYSMMVADYVDKAQLGKHGSCHVFRHTMATVMLENGADIRYIQVMLGHADLTTTQVYTQVSIGKLKEIHAATHPSARAPGGDEKQELLSSLAAELEEDPE